MCHFTMERIELRKSMFLLNFIMLLILFFYTVDVGAEQDVLNDRSIMNNTKNQDILDIVVFQSDFSIELSGVAKVICDKTKIGALGLNYTVKKSESKTTQCKSVNDLRNYVGELELKKTNYSKRIQNLTKMLSDKSRDYDNKEKLLNDKSREYKKLQQVMNDKNREHLKLEEKINTMNVDLQKTKARENELKQLFARQCKNVDLENCSICGTTTTILSNITNGQSSMAPDTLSAGFDNMNILFIGIGLCVFIVIVIGVTVYIRRKGAKGSHEITPVELPNHSNEELTTSQPLPINAVASESGIVYKSKSESTPTIPEITLKMEDFPITENNIDEIEDTSTTCEAENNSNINL